jgi:hypothetical protein
LFFCGSLYGDGKPDLATANNTGLTVSVFLNQGAGAFAAKVDYGAGSGPEGVVGPTALAVGDLNGDGKPDLAVTSADPNSVSVFLNQCM